jgi:hypothetical protein
MLLADLDHLRRRTRSTRQAYWFPLLVFGLIEAASALVADPGLTGSPIVTGFRAVENQTGYHTLLLVSIAGTALTLWWYRRHADRTGVETPVRPVRIAAVGASAIVVLGAFLAGLVPLVLLYYVFGVPGNGWLFVVAAVLLALAVVERSALLWAVALLHGVAAVMGVTYDPENLLFRIGFSSEDVPSGIVNVLLPAGVLLTGCAVAVVRTRRATP